MRKCKPAANMTAKAINAHQYARQGMRQSTVNLPRSQRNGPPSEGESVTHQSAMLSSHMPIVGAVNVFWVVLTQTMALASRDMVKQAMRASPMGLGCQLKLGMEKPVTSMVGAICGCEATQPGGMGSSATRRRMARSMASISSHRTAARTNTRTAPCNASKTNSGGVLMDSQSLPKPATTTAPGNSRASQRMRPSRSSPPQEANSHARLSYNSARLQKHRASSSQGAPAASSRVSCRPEILSPRSKAQPCKALNSAARKNSNWMKCARQTSVREPSGMRIVRVDSSSRDHATRLLA